jgi:ABC-2 type transport system permease protein
MIMKVIRSILTLAGKDLKILFKDRGQLAVLFLLPLILSLMLGGSYATAKNPVKTSGEPKLAIRTLIANGDQGLYGEQLVEVLEDIQPLRTQRLRSTDQADRKVVEGDAAAAIIIPTDFSTNIDNNHPIQIQLIKDPTRQAEAQVVAGILNEVLTELSVRAEIEYGIWAVYAKAGLLDADDPESVRAAQAQTMGAIWTAVQDIRSNPAIALQVEDLSDEGVVIPASGVVFGAIMPVFATMFAFFLIGFMAESILKEKGVGSFRRLLAAPMPHAAVITGKLLAFIGVVFMQMLVLFGICNLFFDMPFGKSPLALLALTLALSLASTSLGMLLGSVSQTIKQAGSLGMVLGFVLFLASGYTSFSIDTTGGVLNLSIPNEGVKYYLSQLTPHAHAVDGYYQLILYHAGLAEVVPNILALLAFAAVFFLVAMWRFKFD